MERTSVLSLSLQQRIFIAVGLFAILTLGVMWVLVRPSYERSVIDERTTVVQQVQQYAVQRADELFTGWTTVTRYLAHQAETAPEHLDVAMQQNIALRPDILQITITSPSVTEELVVTNAEHRGFDYRPPDDGWRPYPGDTAAAVQLHRDAARNKLFFSARRSFTADGRTYTVTTVADAAEAAAAFTDIPIDGGVASLVHDGPRIIVGPPVTLDSASLSAPANASVLRPVTMLGEPWFMLTARLASAPYTSTVLIPEALFLAPVHRLFYFSAALVLGLVLIVIVLGWVVSYQISRPVTRLVEEVERLSTLDFSRPIAPVALADIATIGTTIESMRQVLARYQRINVEKIIFEEWKNRFFLSHSQDMIALTNPDGTFLFQNDRFAELRAELAATAPCGAKDDLLIHPSVARSKESSSDETSGAFHIRIRQAELKAERDGKHPRFLRFHDVTIMRGAENLGSLLTVHDLTNERLIDQMKTDMMNVIAHELRNPLNSVIGFAELILEEDEVSREELEKYLGIIKASGTTMNKLITRFLDVQRLESGTAEYPKERVDLAEIVRMLVLSQKPVLREKSLDVRVSVAEHLPAVHASHDLMREAVLNLLSNAIKYGDPGRTIEIDLRNGGPEVVLSITDHGYGIPAEDQERLFSKFYRVTSNRKAHRQIGTGLGLAHVKEVMKYHGGDVHLESSPEIGCRFTLTIPVEHRG